MSFYGRSNRAFLEQALQKGGLEDSQVVECDLDNLAAENAWWRHSDLRDLNANNAVFKKCQLEDSRFFRSNFKQAAFLSCEINKMVFDGLTLIKSKWNDCWLSFSSMQNCCLQRSAFLGTRIISSSLIDFEALNISMDNCLVAHSTVGINYGSGMNGFSGGNISNCVFYHCRFEGYPFRGAKLNSNVFMYCSGEIGDDMECANTAGLGLKGHAGFERLRNAHDAQTLIERLVS